MTMNFLDSPKEGALLSVSRDESGNFDGHNSGSSPEELGDDFIKVKLFFYSESKSM